MIIMTGQVLKHSSKEHAVLFKTGQLINSLHGNLQERTQQMGKLKQLVIEAEDIIHSIVQDGWDEAVGTVEDMKNHTLQNIDDALEDFCNEHGIQFDDLDLLYMGEDYISLEDKIANVVDEIWEIV